MNVLDLAVLGIVLISAFLAFYRGLIREVLSIMGWVAAALVTLYAFPLVQPHARSLVSMKLAADVGAALVIFLVTLIVFSIVGGVLAKRIHNTDFKPLDRSLGFIFGALRGLVLLCLAYLLVNWAFKPDEQPQWARDARSLPVLAYGANLLTQLVPEDFLKGAKVGVNDLRERSETNARRAPSIGRLLRPPPIARDGQSGSTEGKP